MDGQKTATEVKTDGAWLRERALELAVKNHPGCGSGIVLPAARDYLRFLGGEVESEASIERAAERAYRAWQSKMDVTERTQDWPDIASFEKEPWRAAVRAVLRP